MSEANPLLEPVRASFQHKRSKKDGLVPANWLLVVLCLLDKIRQADRPLTDDEVYTYDYTLKDSRSAIGGLLEKYQLPPSFGVGKEGVTVRGAPGLRLFRALDAGGIIMDRPRPERERLIDEAVQLVRAEIDRRLEQKPVVLPNHVFEHTSLLVEALLKAVRNRSVGRVEQALVGAKLELRFPEAQVNASVGFAGDRQTGRESDFEVGNLRVIVSAAPKDLHFDSAVALAREGREVYLVVGERNLATATRRIQEADQTGRVTVDSVARYVTSNMKETAHDRGIDARAMCLQLVEAYNRRMGRENAPSLLIASPA